MSRWSWWVRIAHPKCMMKRVVPVTFSRHKERAIDIGVVVVSIDVALQFFSSRQVPNEVCIADSRLYRGDLHEVPMSSSCLRQSNTSLPWMSTDLLKNCVATYLWVG
jgi:hypothetical protein